MRLNLMFVALILFAATACLWGCGGTAAPPAAPIVGGAAADDNSGLKRPQRGRPQGRRKAKDLPGQRRKAWRDGQALQGEDEGLHLLPLLQGVSARVKRPPRQVSEEAEGLTAGRQPCVVLSRGAASCNSLGRKPQEH